MTAQLPDPSVGAPTDLRQRVAELEQENARLVGELELRNRELAEAVEQQTATAEVLRAIASAPTSLDTVLGTLVASAARLTNADEAVILRIEGSTLPVVASTSGHPAISANAVMPLDERSVSGRAIRERRAIVAHEPCEEHEAKYPASVMHKAGFRAEVVAPLLHGDAVLGTLIVFRRERLPFDERHVALVTTFADQAVIAIETARIFEELQERNRELAEALDQQTATSEVLKAISRSARDLQPVLDTLVENARRLCSATQGFIFRLDGGLLHLTADSGVAAVSPELRAFVQQNPRPIARDSAVGRAATERRVVHIPDVLEDPEFNPEFHRLGEVRTVLGVPMLREGSLVGVFALWRREPRPFTDKQVALVTTFADQAVIAIENARLFGELTELNRTLEARVSEQVEELERVGRLRRYLSPQLAELIVSSGDESILGSHRRQISVLFCDLRGFTAFAETAEPEEVMGVLAEYHAAMGELIRRHEGTLDRFAGDGLMVFFNDPLPQADHAERAVRLACAMRARAAELARGWRRQGHELGFGVGLAVGYATLGRIGFEGRYDYTAIGTVANLAARLCGEAAGGQILISERLHGMVEELVEAEPVGELALKGLHRPVAALNLVTLRDGEATGAGGVG